MQEEIHEVQVEYIDEWMYPAQDFLIWEIEQAHGARIVSSLAMPHVDNPDLKLDSPELLQAFLNANKWSAVNYLGEKREEEENEVRLISPWQSAVQVEDYQLYPVLKAMLMPRISLLLADDVGLGKTIEAGLILSEMYARRRIRRVLIVCPASLQLQWRDEMREKFHLDFTIVDRDETFRLQRDLGVDSNPWKSYPRIITSMDYLRQKDILESFMAVTRTIAGPFEGTLPWQVLVVDEAHNFTPSKFGDDSDRCQMLRTISSWFEHRIFLSATPHNGYTISFTGLLELLDPVRFQQKPTLTEDDHRQIAHTMVRRLKRDLSEENERKRFTDRYVEQMKVSLHEREKQLFAALRAYREALHTILKEKSNKRELHLGEFLIKLLTKRLLSSSYAFARTWWQHVEGMESHEQDFMVMEHAVDRAELPMNDDQERGQREEDAIKQTGAWASNYASRLQKERRVVSDCLEGLGWGKDIMHQDLKDMLHMPEDARWEQLQGWIREKMQIHGKLRDDERLIIFTEYKHTLDYLQERFRRDEQLTAPFVECLFGGVSSKTREHIKDAFNDARDPLRILIGTDTVSEGINLQATCRYVIHQEIPWNPMRMEQRNGRVDRHGQERDVYVYHFASDDEADMAFMAFIAEKVKQARSDLGSVGQVIDKTIEKYFTRGLLTKEEIDTRIEKARNETKESEDLRDVDKGQVLSGADTRRLSALAMQRLTATERLLGLSPAHVAQVLQRAVTRESGKLQKEVGEPVYVFNPVPPTWKKLVKETMQRQQGGASGIPKLVFDPNVLVKHTKSGIRIYKPRIDRELVRLGHPLMRRAIGVLRRKMWEFKGDPTTDLFRWTMSGSDTLPSNTEAVVLLHLFLEVSNKFREVAHQEVLSFAFAVHGSKLLPYEEPVLLHALESRFMLSDIIRDQTAPRIHELWLEHEVRISTFIQEKQGHYQGVFSERMQRRRKDEQYREQNVFSTRLNELKKYKEPARLKVLRRASERLQTFIEQGESQQSLFDDIQLDKEIQLAQAKQQQEVFAWELWAEDYIEQLKELVEKEQKRVLDYVLPKRYALASIDLQPLTIEYIVSTTREE